MTTMSTPKLTTMPMTTPYMATLAVTPHVATPTTSPTKTHVAISMSLPTTIIHDYTPKLHPQTTFMMACTHKR